MLAPRLHVVHGGPALSLEAGGAISATELKVDFERRGGLNICPFVCVCVCVVCVTIVYVVVSVFCLQFA